MCGSIVVIDIKTMRSVAIDIDTVRIIDIDTVRSVATDIETVRSLPLILR